jgi:FixJ family two-component response regulator
MGTPLPAEDRPQCRLRVLVVDNDAKTREQHTRLLLGWGFIPVVARGTGEELLTDAVRQARDRRCQVALVDMRLRDDYDKRDWSGLELVPKLHPTAAIIVSGFGDRKSVVSALKEYGAFDFVGKEDGPEQIQKTIEEAAHQLSACVHRAHISWSHDLSSERIRDLLFPDRPDVPDDEADELIGRMFPQAQRVALTLIADDLDAPLDDLSEVFGPVSALRRQSRVFRATIDDQRAFRVVKLARTDKIARELSNYHTYVQFGLQEMYRPEQFAEALLWDIGGVAYSYVGNSGLGAPGGPRTFTTYYRAAERADQILPPLRHFFALTNWGNWYRNEIKPLGMSLFDAYDTIWRGVLRRSLNTWAHHDRQHQIDGFPASLPNPTRWLADHFQTSQLVLHTRQAVTHGDLHGDNLFVDKDRAWPIDFERTGPGPILRDFVELTQDIMTRIGRLGAGDLDVMYELIMAICASQLADTSMPISAAIRDNAEALKALEVVRGLQCLAYERAQYDDQREYLWGLLLNNMFVLTLLPEDSGRQARTLLFASVICSRLDHWERRSAWPPKDWPPIEWLEQP